MKAARVTLIVLLVMASGVHAEPQMKSSTTNPEILAAFRGYVLKRDYNCPVAKAIARYPQDEYGDVFRLFCKTDPETDVILDFRITVSPKGNYIVRKW
ncbi:hypothetical protein V5F77_05080 [Xanthobacter sp. DSM 24535]|uniref:hypothetical protein n=1 Tax=Roseixanthobacter psychrophilus TaxID=3119917 RepID=UPI0037271BBA